MQAVLLWQLASLARDTGRYRGMTLTHLAGFLLLGTIASRHISALPLPLWLSLAISVCLGFALLRPPVAVR